MTQRIALVTGVVGNIGASIAKKLASVGATVVITDLKGPEFEKVRETLNMPAIAADLGDRGEVTELVDRVSHDFGAPDILVSAAGGVCGQIHQPLEKVSESDWRILFAANVDSAFFLSQAVAVNMKKTGWGRIITISSGAGLRPSRTGIQAYAAAKHALVGLTRQLSQELGRYGITVNSIAPGFILSNPATLRQWQGYGAQGQRRLVEEIHTRRIGTPDDIANAAAFFASEESSWISGQVLLVDGGSA